MRNVFMPITVWIVIITIAAYIVVMGISKRNPTERITKFIPSIVCFVFAANLTYLLLYGWETILTNILIMLVIVFLEFLAVVGLLSTLLVAWIIDIKVRKKSVKEGLEENEEV